MLSVYSRHYPLFAAALGTSSVDSRQAAGALVINLDRSPRTDRISGQWQ